MKCPHCLVAFHEDETAWNESALGRDRDGHWGVESILCPECKRLVVRLVCQRPGPVAPTFDRKLVHPKAVARTRLPSDVPASFADTYTQASLVLADSAMASAALSRRCLQEVLREAAKVKYSDLSDEIEQVLKAGRLPTHLAEAIDGVRAIGNFAAHPIKSKNTGEIVDVEPGEAEWLLDVLEGLFDFYFVQPAILQRKRDALNQKLQEAGKPTLK